MPDLSVIAALFKRIQVLATSALSYLTIISGVLVALAQQLDGVAGVPEWATRVLASAIALIGVIILQVRRVTPVAAADKGLLPPKGPAAEADPNRDVGEVGLSVLFRLLALAAFVVVALVGFEVITTTFVFGWLGLGLAAWILSTFVT